MVNFVKVLDLNPLSFYSRRKKVDPIKKMIGQFEMEMGHWFWKWVSQWKWVIILKMSRNFENGSPRQKWVSVLKMDHLVWK